MNLLVLAQTPPPHHGQSAMVQLLLDELPRAAPEIPIHHVNLALSPTDRDIGRWQPGKLLAARRALRAARATLARHGCDTLYYVPAPGKRIALWRDLLLLRALRPHVPRLVLHWHASGLGHWLQHHATAWERHAAHRTLGHADLSIVLAPSLAADAQKLAPQRTAIVPNGIPDPFADSPIPSRRAPAPDTPLQVLFLGAGSTDKGLSRTIDALDHLPPNTQLTFAGAFPSPDDAQRFAAARSHYGDRLHHAGFVDATARRELLRDAHVLAFPTTYPHEAFPLVLIEALAADLPIVTTRWRAIPELLPPDFAAWTSPDDPASLAATLDRAARHPPGGAHRAYYLSHYTPSRFAANLATALRTIP